MQLSSALNNEFSKYTTNEGCHGIKPLKHITMVGALLEKGKNSGDECKLSDNDHYFLWKTLEELHKNGIPIAKDFHVDVVNKDYGRNFLNEENKTDLVVLCNIDPVYRLQINDWKNRIKDSAAKVISVIGFTDGDSLSYRDFKGKNANYFSSGKCGIPRYCSGLYTENMEHGTLVVKNNLKIEGSILPSGFVDKTTNASQHQGRHR